MFFMRMLKHYSCQEASRIATSRTVYVLAKSYHGSNRWNFFVEIIHLWNNNMGAVSSAQLSKEKR